MGKINLKKKRDKLTKNEYERQRINTTIRSDLIELLDNEIQEFRDLDWSIKSKTWGTVNDIKYILTNYVVECYYGNLHKHKDDEGCVSIPYQELGNKLGQRKKKGNVGYKKIMDICFNDLGGIKMGDRRLGGSTRKYKLKPEIKILCDKVYIHGKKIHSIPDRSGNKIRDIRKYSVNRITGGEIIRTTDPRKYPFDVVVQLNKENLYLQRIMWETIYEHKSKAPGALSSPNNLDYWLNVLKRLDVDYDRLTLKKIDDIYLECSELDQKTSIDIIGKGRILQPYNEKPSGRLYGDGKLNLQNMRKVIRYIVMGGCGYYEYDLENAHYNIVYQYNKMIGGLPLDNIGKYIRNTEGTRESLSKEIGVDVGLIKLILIEIIYGSTIENQKWTDYETRKITINTIMKECIGYTNTRNESLELWRHVSNNKTIKELWTDVGLFYNHLRKSWKTLNTGLKQKLYNPVGKPIYLNIEKPETKRGYGLKSRGKLQSHFIQGIESGLLLFVIEEEQKSFILPHHDGWVSRINWDTNRLEDIIYRKSIKMMNSYDGIDGGFRIKIKKRALEDLIPKNIQLEQVVGVDWNKNIFPKRIENIGVGV